MDSSPSTGRSDLETSLKSVFEDWEDPIINDSVVLEEDGSQTLLITSDSPFFEPPSAAKPFSAAFPNPTRRETIAANEIPTSAVPPLTPHLDEQPVLQLRRTPEKSTKRQVLFIDTATSTSATSVETCFTLSASAFFSAQSVDEIPVWMSDDLFRQPDVPLDLESLYSAVAEVSASDQWEVCKLDGHWHKY